MKNSSAPEWGGWTDQLLRVFLESGMRLSRGDRGYPLLIRLVNAKYDLSSDSECLSSCVQFFATLGCDSPSLAAIRTSISVHSRQGNARALELAPGAVGYLMLTEQYMDSEDKRRPELAVVLLGSRNLEAQLLELFFKAQSFGIDRVPIWIHVDTAPIASMMAADLTPFFLRRQLAITGCSCQQTLELT